ncbi:AMP-binding protein [Nocardioides halotolerans]|uniref:AMP-binding protein n=1 Tax=Nocardioides halotolerans TaxID=433660 RepID=UPI00146A82CD|nr:AMP-binding protein [Nocardioides halotolerans]
MVEAWADFARTRGTEPAVTVDGESVTWTALDVRSNQLAHALADVGVVSGDMVSIALPNSVDAAATVMAVLKLGATPQYVSHRLPAAELSAILELARPRVLVCESDLVPETAISRVRPSDVPTDARAEALPLVVAEVMKAPTSGGSTGRPKIILSGGSAVVDSAPHHPMRRMGFPLDGVVYTGSPLYHNLALVALLSGLSLGNHVVLTAKFDAAQALDAWARHRVTYALIVPTMMIRISRLPDEVRHGADLSALEMVVHAAGPCPPDTKRAWMEWLGPHRVYENYGTTEQVALAFVSGEEWLDRPGTVGRSILGEFDIREAGGSSLPRGTEGLIHMRRPGQGRAFGYLGVDEEPVVDGWETFGDLGWMDEDGYLYISDRRTDLIICGGANIYPAEVEGQLIAHPAVSDCVVVGLPDSELGRTTHAIVQHDGAPPEEADLRAFMRERLALYKNPRSYEFTTVPFRDDSGKVRRSRLVADRVDWGVLQPERGAGPSTL